MSALTASAPTQVPAALGHLQRRTVRALVATQVAGGAGTAAGITVAALLAVELGGSAASAGLAEAAAVAGTAASTLPLARGMARHGRRRGLAVAWSTGAVGALVVVVAALVGSLPLLLLGMVAVGAAGAGSDAARHVATDLASASSAGRAIGTVVAATGISMALGPWATAPVAALAGRAGLPPLTGPFVLAVLAFGAAAVVVTVRLRPDPLTIARATVGVTPRAPGSWLRGAPALLALPDVRLAAVAVAIGNGAMLGLMVLAPVHVAAAHADHADALAVIGPMISLHVVAMFAPSPLTGRLADRIGARAVVAIGAVVVGAAGLAFAMAAPTEVGMVTGALVLLGLGWNACFVASARLLVAAVGAGDRPRAQGLVDTVAAVTAMASSLLAGLLAAHLGHLAVGALIAVAAAVLFRTARSHRTSGRPSHDHLAPHPRPVPARPRHRAGRLGPPGRRDLPRRRADRPSDRRRAPRRRRHRDVGRARDGGPRDMAP